VQCIEKTDRQDAHERIHAIGGLNGDGTRWEMSEYDAIIAIKEGRYSFFVEHPPGRAANVIIAHRFGYEYLKTENDGVQPDNLLALPQCH
jgi:hypothetical protein